MTGDDGDSPSDHGGALSERNPDESPVMDGGTLLSTEPADESGRGTRGLTGFRTLLRREILRFFRRPRNTFLPPAITNVLYFAVFGIVLGGRIDEIAGFDYIVFLLPGLIVLGTISNAFENASFSIFHGRWNEYIETVLTSPLSNWMFVAAYIVASTIRGLLVGGIIAAIGFGFIVLTDISLAVTNPQPVYFVAFMIVISVLFAGLGIIGGLWARDFDYLTVMNQFIIRPLVFFGGVFYSLEILDPVFRTISLFNPMVYMVNGVRYGFLSYSDIDPNVALAVLTTASIVVVLFDVYLFRRGYGLVD
jgi:ABC-2 type transport system permease protein